MCVCMCGCTCNNIFVLFYMIPSVVCFLFLLLLYQCFSFNFPTTALCLRFAYQLSSPSPIRAFNPTLLLSYFVALFSIGFVSFLSSFLFCSCRLSRRKVFLCKIGFYKNNMSSKQIIIIVIKK